MSYSYTDERFLKLSEKITKLQNLELTDPNKQNQLDGQIERLTIDYNRALKDFEYKHKYLEEEINDLIKSLNNLNEDKTNLRNKINLEIKNLELKIKDELVKERENSQIYTNNLFNRLENLIKEIQNTYRQQKKDLIESVQELKEVIEVELPQINSKIIENVEHRKEQIELLKNSVKEELIYLENQVRII
jgi:hypothetical protein